MIWSSHSQYGLYHQSSRFRPQTPQDALIAQRLEEAADEIQTQYWKSLYPEKIKKIQQEIVMSLIMQEALFMMNIQIK